MKIHSDEAWNIASQFSYTLASDTRTLAAMIDTQLATARNEALEEAAQIFDDGQQYLGESARALICALKASTTTTQENE